MGPRDKTPEATHKELDRKIPGIAEALRSSGLSANSLHAGLSRGIAGVSGSTVIVNIAGSREAIRDGMATLSTSSPRHQRIECLNPLGAGPSHLWDLGRGAAEAANTLTPRIHLNPWRLVNHLMNSSGGSKSPALGLTPKIVV